MTERSIIIAPSLLAADFTRLGDDVRRVEDGGADWLHVDVMDGHFVPNLSIGLPVVEAVREIASCPLDVHIMISNPETYAERYVEAGAESVTFHLEATEDPLAVAKQIRDAGAKVGMALSPPTPLSTLKPYLDAADFVLVMTVHPGFGGQSFMPEMLAKVRELRHGWGYEGIIQVDGGISIETVTAAAEAGANAFVAGTGIFKSESVPGTIAEMRELARTVLT